MAATVITEVETELAAEQKGKLVKTLGSFDTVFFILATIVGLDLVGQAASNGLEATFWTVILVLFFLLPYGMVMAEIGSGFALEGGPYEWVKLTMGRFWASVNTIFYWVTNPLWVGGSLAFIATEAFSDGITGIEGGSVWDYAFKLAFIWLTIGSAIVSFKVGKWVPTTGAILKVVLVTFFAITVIVYGIDNGIQGLSFSDLSPTRAGLLAIVPLILFSFVGFESANGAAEEMKDPQKDVPSGILKSGLLAAFCYVIPIFLIVLVLPAEKITGIGGFLDAVQESYSIYGGAADLMFGVTCLLFIYTLMNSGSSWMMSGDRTLAVASADGGFFPWIGEFNAKLGTPVRANVLSGVIATAFMIAAVLLLNSGSESGAATFTVVLYIAISTTLISYILVFIAAYLLRRKYPTAHRPFRIPGGDGVMLLCSGLITFWVLLGSWTAVFPGTLNRLIGLDYSYEDEWGMSSVKFFAFNLGTLAVIVVIAVVGYIAAAKVRSRTVERTIASMEASLGTPAPAAADPIA